MFYSARKSVVQHGFELGISLEIMEYTIGQTVKKKNRPIFNYVRFMRSFADEAMRKILDHIKEPLHSKKQCNKKPGRTIYRATVMGNIKLSN